MRGDCKPSMEHNDYLHLEKQFLNMLLKLINAKNTMEINVYTRLPAILFLRLCLVSLPTERFAKYCSRLCYGDGERRLETLQGSLKISLEILGNTVKNPRLEELLR